MISYNTLPEAFNAWKRESLAAHIPSELRPFYLAGVAGLAKLVRDFPALFDAWTVDDWRELELRFWWRFVPGTKPIDWILHVAGRMIDRRQFQTPMNQYGKPWFSESLDDCRDDAKVAAERQRRQRVRARFGIGGFEGGFSPN